MKVIKAEDTRSLEPFRDRIIEGDCLEVMKDIHKSWRHRSRQRLRKRIVLCCSRAGRAFFHRH